MNPSQQQVVNSELSYENMDINSEAKAQTIENLYEIEHDHSRDMYNIDRDNSLKKFTAYHDLLGNQNLNFIEELASSAYIRESKDEEIPSDIHNSVFHTYNEAQMNNGIIKLEDVEQEHLRSQNHLIKQDAEDELGLLFPKVEQKNMPIVLENTKNKCITKQKLTNFSRNKEIDQISHYIQSFQQQNKASEEEERRQLQIKNFKMIRKEKIQRYLQKKKNRRYNQIIMYDCRKTVADRRLRYKGRFINEEQAIQILHLQANKEYEISFLKQQLKNLQKN